MLSKKGALPGGHVHIIILLPTILVLGEITD
jgi:hypothetical protein